MNTKITGLGIVLIWVGLFIAAEQAYGTTINVPGDAATIQEAINDANDGDTVRVAEDTYYENLNFTDQKITLTSTDPNDANVVASTVINGNDAGSVIIFSSGDADSTVTGFTITNGSAASGGGIYCNSTSPTIRNCVITENSAANGGGIYNYSADPDIINCVFNDNSASGSGGGIYNCYESNANLTNCVFYSNSATYCGGAAINDGLLTAKFTNCTLTKNTATSGGGIYVTEYTSTTIKNCILWDDTGGEIDITTEYASATISYSDIEGCGGSANWDSGFGTDGGGNIDSYPYFADSSDADGSDNIFATSDDGLVPLYSSLCIDDGNNTGISEPNDIKMDARIFNGTVDMGAYEFRTCDVIYVDTDAAGNDDGTSWVDAYNDLQDALTNASSGDEIWVAEGTYKPHASDPSVSFELVAGVDVYGGFDGIETDRSGRDWTENTATLSGDITEDNSCHVVKGANNALLDGFTITKGNADGSYPNNSGGGIYCSSASPTIRNCVITDNSAAYGGGICNYSADPDIINCVFNDNSATSFGGGMYTCDQSDANITSSVFYTNTATYGGAIYADGFLTVKLTNCTLAKNTATYTGGIYIYEYTSATIKNCILWDNTGGEIDITSDYASAAVSYSDIEGCGGSGGGWDSSFGTDGGGNIDNDPYFVNAADPDGKDNIFCTRDDGLMVGPNSLCIDAANGNVAAATDITGWPRIDIEDVNNTGTGDPNYVDMGAYEKFEYLRFGMEVVSVTTDANGITVVTTGATYVLDSNGMDMFRRIDPNTNAIDNANSGKGRKVAELSFDPNLGTLSVYTYDKSRAIIDSNKADFEFMSDSFFIITAKESLDVNHTNLIANAPWNAPLEPNDRDLDRMWTDGYGGSLHAMLSDSTKGEANSVDVNSTTITLAAGDKSAHMVFPPKTFDFTNLYGQNARPHVRFIYHEFQMNEFTNDPNKMNSYKTDGFGIFVLFALYDDREYPTVLDSGIMGYNMANPDAVQNFINAADANGFKVITYCAGPGHSGWNYPAGHPLEGQHQDISVTLDWMRDFQAEYNLDGWYFDNADTGDLVDDYDFMRQVRTDVGPTGIIYHHDSVDVWSMTGGNWNTGYKGLRAIMVDAYVNYALTGETGEIGWVDDPNDNYFRFYTSGYGMSQVYGSLKRASNGKAAMSYEEIFRTIATNLNGSQRERPDTYTYWQTHFKPAYNTRKAEYLNDANVPFDPDVDWPLDGNSSDPNLNWFRLPTDINVIDVNSNSATITWTTGANSDSEVVYTNEEFENVWWYYKDANGKVHQPAGSEYDSNMVTDHSLTLTDLDPDTDYEFKIRSTNDTNDPPAIPGQIIWGYVGSFTTEP